MAELLVRVVDKGDHPLASKAGNVITIQPDGWQWTADERNAVHWRIVRLPGADVAMLAHLLETAVDGQGVMVARRLRSFDVAHSQFKPFLVTQGPHTVAAPDDLLSAVRTRQHSSKVDLP